MSQTSASILATPKLNAVNTGTSLQSVVRFRNAAAKADVALTVVV